MPFYKTIPVPDRGVAFHLKPHAIDPRAWATMEGFRTRTGSVRSLPGWNAIVTPPLGEPILGLAEFFRPATFQHFYVVLTSTEAYSLDMATGVLTNITGSALLLGFNAAPFSFAVFGGTLYITSLFTTGIYKWDGEGDLELVLDTLSFASINTINDYLIGFNEREGDARFPYDLHWAAEATDDKWIADATTDSGRFPISDTMDQGVALHRLGNDLIAYKERTIIPISFIGGNEVFGRRAAVSGVGLLGPNALVAVGDRHIFMGQEAIYAYGGGNVVDDSIGDPVRDKLYGDLNPNPSFGKAARGLYLHENLEVAFFYVSKEHPGAPNGTLQFADKVVIYNLKDGTWYGPMKVTDFVSATANFTRQESARHDILGTLSGQVCGFGSSYTENGLLTTRTLESGDHNLQTEAIDFDGNKILFPLSTVFQVNVVNLDIEDTGHPVMEFFIGSRLDLNDAISWQGPIEIYGTGVQTIRVPVRRTGRWFRIKITTQATLEFALLGYQFEFERVGNR